MRKYILCTCFVLLTLCTKSQIQWSPGFTKYLEEYIFIPVEFDHFGNWIAGIENDSSVIFKKKQLSIENDSLYIDFQIEKPGFPSPVKFAKHSVSIYGKTSTVNNLKAINKSVTGINLKSLPAEKVTTIYISCRLSFPPTEKGKLLASETMDDLETKFSGFFDKKRVIKSLKNKKRRKFHPDTEKDIRFSMNENPMANFWLRNNSFQDKNEISVYLSYVLTE